MKVTDSDRIAARMSLREVRFSDPVTGERVLESVAKAIAAGREWENKGCEVDVLGESCDVNSRCGHAACQPKHADARIIARRRSA